MMHDTIVKTIRFADGIVMLAKEEMGLQSNLGRTNKIIKANGVKLSKSKTKITAGSKNKDTNSLGFKIRTVIVMEVREIQVLR